MTAAPDLRHLVIRAYDRETLIDLDPSRVAKNPPRRSDFDDLFSDKMKLMSELDRARCAHGHIAKYLRAHIVEAYIQEGRRIPAALDHLVKIAERHSG